MAESDREAEQSKEEGLAQEETTGQELGWGVLSSNLTQYYGIPPSNNYHAIGKRRPVQKKRSRRRKKA